ncbi:MULTISPECIES: hypothetical protein [unclassified Sphingobium]|uniref:hypothetical protein n=1 Tax=unclassified Sphingobium TaxID=2611147 RepID=UPI0007F4D58E|nr:hypothetical protein A7Q26_06315 [Sphingobium sp. TCM1]
MVEDPFASQEPQGRREPPMRSHGSGLVFALVALALLLAIAFFYLTNDRREDRRADKVTEAAGAVDDAAGVVGDAARNAADTLRNRN